MARRIAVTNLDASTIDILNVIRQNASAEYQQLVPKVEKALDIPRVGEVLYGYPALANQFLSQLVNRIALVRVKSATFNNMYKTLKKGYLDFGETVEEVFVNISKAREFSAEKAADRELRRTLPDVRSAFHTMNWRVQYPVTIQDEDLRMAFLSMEGVQDLIARIVDSVYTSAEYDEFLLFKYLLIKSISHGKAYPTAVAANDLKENAVAFRGASNMLTFMSTKYNAAGVHTATPRSDQIIFMDAMYNASFDVEVLASAFNMDKADFMGRLFLIDNWSDFDMDRFSIITANSDMLEPITEEELTLLKGLKAVVVDEEFFQVYDNQNKFTETYVSSGEYWNYNYNVWKTVSYSPFSNIVAFFADTTNIALPETITCEVQSKSVGENATVLTLVAQDDTAGAAYTEVRFIQGQAETTAGIAVHPYGAYMFPPNAAAIAAPSLTVQGVTYTGTEISPSTEQGATITFTKQAARAASRARKA